MDKWFFVIGCQRSGTTLARLVLESHTAIQCYDELVAYDILAGKMRADRRRDLLGFKVPRLTERIDRVPFDTASADGAYRMYGGEPLVFMVRDVRDTVSSMCRLSYGRYTWFEVYGLPSLIQRCSLDPALRDVYARMLNHSGTPRCKSLAGAAVYWRYKVAALFDYLERRYPVLVVKYEDLVRQPEAELRRVCRFLAVPWQASMLSHESIEHGELCEDGRAIGNTDPTRPIDQRSVGQWEGHFTEEETAVILEAAGPVFTQLYSCEYLSR
jgi:protein-tyrosine sulfotransferase